VPSRRSTVSWASLAVSVICVTAFVIFLVVQLSQGDLDRGDKLASIISMSVTVVTLPISIYAIVVSLRQSQPVIAASPSARLDAMAEALAIAVRTQWEAEEHLRRVHDPFPLPARWTNAPDLLVDHWPKINNDPSVVEPLLLDGHGDHIVDTFNQVPSGRLVVLGRAGAGKTILTSRFALTLLAGRSVPVPVIFSLGSWNPTAQSFRDWQADQLITTYPILAERDSTGATIATLLLNTGRILPVLDGFDEISEGYRVDAINAINADLRAGDRLLMTSRPDEYTAAVRAAGVLNAAAVVQLEDLTIDDLAEYLPLTPRKGIVHNGLTKWSPVLGHLRADPGAPLADALTTPLMVALARAIFSDTDADPEELLKLNSPVEIEERLLDGFVPAVYSDAGRFNVAEADRSLSFLATQLHQLGTYDLAWWQFVRAVPRLVVGVISSVVIGIMVWLSLGPFALLASWPGDGRIGWLVGGFVDALVCGVAGGTIVGLDRGMRPSPVRVRLRLSGRLGRVRHDLGQRLLRWRTLVWFVAWSLAGGWLGLFGLLFVDSPAGIAVGLGAGLVVGVGNWVVITVVRALETPVDPTDTVSPAELLRIDRGTSLGEGFAIGAGISTMVWFMIWLGFEPTFRLPFGQVFGGGLWLLGWLDTLIGGVLIWMLFVSAWGPWLIARSWLSLTGRLPWAVMAFLADAHRRGVLRQAGGVYQFRHARLQDHLAGAGEYRRDHASKGPTRADRAHSAAAAASVRRPTAGDSG
jgi:NACHT domain